MKNIELGKYGEVLARKYLTACGYEILAANWRCRFGEIDLIAQKEGRVIFFEVKTRHSDFFGTAEEAVDYRKTRKILKTAFEFLTEWKLRRGNPAIYGYPRIDVIAIDLNMYNMVKNIKHFKNIYESK